MLEITDRFLPRTERALVERVVAAVREYVERPDLEVSLLLTDDKEIGELHEQFLDDPSPTDVMSFEMDDGAELVVSVETAQRVAIEAGHALEAEVALYIVHGMLHTVGYDDIDDDDRSRMRDAERAIMSRLQLTVRAVDS
ncbi:MAG: putative rRNA maturation factor [Planctomycetota bacterium]|jgi:probable rRNA maturation factor